MRPVLVIDRAFLFIASAVFGPGLAACDADEVGKLCVQQDFVSQCPVGSNPTRHELCGRLPRGVWQWHLRGRRGLRQLLGRLPADLR